MCIRNSSVQQKDKTMLTKRSGVCGSQNGYPDRTYMQQTKLGWLRSLVVDFSTFEAMYNQVPQGTNIAVVITGETQGLNNDFWSAGWRDRYTAQVTEFCERFYEKVRLIEFMNEWDFWGNEDRITKAVELAIVGTDICKRYGILGVLGSVASSNWVSELAQASSILDDMEQATGYKVVHGFAFHPYVSYVERTGDFVVPGHDAQPDEGWVRLSDKVRSAIQVCGGRTCAVTEVGIKIGDAGSEEQQAIYVHGVFQDELALLTPDECMCMCYFAWCDQNGAPSERGNDAFGLIGEQGNLRAAYRAALYQFINTPVVDVPVFRLLEGSQAPQESETGGNPPQDETPPTTETKITTGQEVPTMTTLADAHQLRWQAAISHAPYHHDFGFETAWRATANRWWGSPLTADEGTLDDGRPFRAFSNCVVAYNADGSVEVLS